MEYNYRPLSADVLAEIEDEFDDILSKRLHPFLEGGLREYRVHFILRTFRGLLNYDIDNLFYRPENNWKSMAISIKSKLHDIDLPYREIPTDFLMQLIFNKDCTEFQVANENREILFTGDRQALEYYIQTLLFERKVWNIPLGDLY